MDIMYVSLDAICTEKITFNIAHWNNARIVRTLLGHVGSARVEDAHGAAELCAGKGGGAGDRDAAEDLASEGASSARALDHHLKMRQ